MIREAVEADASRMDAFLAQHAETSMFLRGNLEAHGIGFSDHPNSTRVLLWEKGAEFGVFGVSKAGYLMTQMPGMTDAAAHAFLRAIPGQKVLGMTGDAQQVKTIMRVFDLDARPRRLCHDEPLYSLALDQLDGSAPLSRLMVEDDLPLLEPWFEKYLFETGQSSRIEAAAGAPGLARAALVGGSTELLLVDDTPVAMAALNAKAADLVQIGGVFVPEAQRGNGYGGTITLALLHRVRQAGASRAISFANNPIAARCYEQIGFEHIGQYRIALLQDPCEVPL